MDPATIMAIVTELTAAMQEQFAKWKLETWQNEVIHRLAAIEASLNQLTTRVNQLFAYTLDVVLANTLMQQNSYLAGARNNLDNIVKNAKKFNKHDGWPRVENAEYDIVAGIQRVASDAGGIFTNSTVYKFTAFASAYQAAMTEIVAMLVMGVERRTIADRLSFYLTYFDSALGTGTDSLVQVHGRLHATTQLYANVLSAFPKSASIGIAHPSPIDHPLMQLRAIWAILDISGDSDTGFSAQPLRYSNEPQPLYPELEGITFGRETTNDERIFWIMSYLERHRAPYIVARDAEIEAQANVKLAETMRLQLKKLQQTL
jgi:hypothetical protein